jgi:hypothetical protein
MKLLQLGLNGNFQEINVSTGGSANFAEEVKIIGSADVAVGYIYTNTPALENSIEVTIEGAVLVEDLDYSVQYLTDRAKIIFINEYASGGLSEISVGEKFHIQYATADSQLEFIKDYVVLDGTDVANGYFDLAVLAKPNSLDLVYENTQMLQNVDYTTTDLSDRTRISFLGEFLPGGLSALEAGETIHFQFCITPD